MVRARSTAPMLNRGHRYPWILVTLLSVNFGIVFFDRNSINVLMPFIQPELRLTNSAIGALASALSLSWALAGFCVGRLSDFLGRRKIILVVCAALFSMASVVSGIAASLATLIAARLLMGIAEGGVMPISQALVAGAVSPERRGIAMGAAQNVGANLLGNFLAPLVLVAFANAYGWRHAFFLTALPGLVIAILMGGLIREPSPSAAVAQAMAISATTVLRRRNVWICSVLSALLVAFLVVFAAFMPLYLVQIGGLDETSMSWAMSMWGLPSIGYAFLVTGASDWLGRRPIVITAGALSALIPLGVWFAHGALLPLCVMFGLGASVSGIYPLVMATIPSETVPPSWLATAMGLTMGLGEIIGGVLSPGLAGMLGDTFGLQIILWILLGISAVIVSFALLIEETAPAVLRRSNVRG